MLTDSNIDGCPFLAARPRAAVGQHDVLLQIDASTEGRTPSHQYNSAIFAAGMFHRSQHAGSRTRIHGVALCFAVDHQQGVIAAAFQPDFLGCLKNLLAHDRSSALKIGTLNSPRRSNSTRTFWPMLMESLGPSILLTRSGPSLSLISAQL